MFEVLHNAVMVTKMQLNLGLLVVAKILAFPVTS